jgi:hypothetical protein
MSTGDYYISSTTTAASNGWGQGYYATIQQPAFQWSTDPIWYQSPPPIQLTEEARRIAEGWDSDSNE